MATEGYVIDPTQAVAAAPSREQERLVALAAAKLSVADVEVVGLAGPEAMVTVGGGTT